MKLGIHGVQPPYIISERNIKIVVVAIPAYYHQISLEVRYMFPDVEFVIDLCDLISDSWTF